MTNSLGENPPTNNQSKKLIIFIIIGAVLFILAAAVVGVSVLLFLAYNAKLIGHSPPRIPTQSFFVDEEDMSVVTRPIADIPPLIGKGGKLTLVRGVFYTYTADKDKRLAYLEKYTEKARDAMEKLQSGKEATGSEAMVAEQGLYVRSPADPKWVPAMSEAGQRIMSSVGERGTGYPPRNDPKDLRIVLPD